MIRQRSGWTFMDVRINFFEAFKDVYGFIAANDVLRFTSMMIGEVMDLYGMPNDFIGHAGGDNFIIITTDEAAPLIRQHLKMRFNEEVLTHYSFIDRQKGHIMAPDESGKIQPTGLMTLAVGAVSPSTHMFADIREITELAAEERRLDASSSSVR
jgi:GGDEF domain-containing protein